MTKIIMDIGINHNGDLDLAKRLIDICHFAGVDYVKFQKRNPEKCVPLHQRNEIRKTPWGEMKYIDYKHRLELSFDQYTEIETYCKSKSIKWFASIWDFDSALFMQNFSNIVKIPSALITDLNLLKICRGMFETLIISTGMSTEKEIEDAIKIGQPDIVLHCNSSYPADTKELNLNYIKWLKDKHPEITIGYSGHEFGLVTTFAAVAMGAEYVERHITIDRNIWGSDQLSSVEPTGLLKLVKGIKDIDQAMGVYGERTVFESEISKRKSLRGV